MTMSHRKFIGIFHSIDTVLYKLMEMKANGYEEETIHVFTREQDNIAMLEGQTKMNLNGSYGEDWRKGFNEFLGIEEPVYNAFNSMRFSEQESKHYLDEVENGGIAMFVDAAFGNELNDADSSADISSSGEVLDGRGNDEQLLHSDGTTPRMKTENL
ncbi:general stress protein [Sporosarcina jiandibaonis]|uniref:general stress protein n=1 Tax=Sporosarcina jiandibaonis TaxID=2715535 RepID=UPI001556AF7D|nr:general stress protein [Sporosarcina jiandibaonis]